MGDTINRDQIAAIAKACSRLPSIVSVTIGAQNSDESVWIYFNGESGPSADLILSKRGRWFVGKDQPWMIQTQLLDIIETIAS